ncbi:MAG: Nif3-like dinuclear metal center hexameric protein, partial [Rikenellaceae bacterium]
IVDLIESFASPLLAESYDNTGLLIGDREAETSKLLVCVDVTEEIVEEAKRVGADMILSHHPLIFSGLKSLTGASYIERCVVEIIRSDMALYCSHTSIDAAYGGVSHMAASMLSLSNVKVLEPTHVDGEGFGVIGEIATKERFSDFLPKLKTIFDAPIIRHTAPHKELVKTIAFCGGSGSSLISRAISLGADLYISADFKYHDFFMAEKRITIADIGHFESEKMVIEIFCNIISKKYPTFVIYKTKINSNPIIYL